MLSFSKSKKNAKESVGVAGSVVRVWEKDPSITNVGLYGTMEIFLAGEIADGPKDPFIAIKGRPEVKADSNQNFLPDPIEDTYNFDTVQTFSYVHRTLSLYRRTLKNIGIQEPLNWQWGEQPISVLPDAGVMENAYYSRQDKSLNFFHFEKNNETIYTCRAEGIVAHETGHAVLDALCPGFLESYEPQTGAIHESFGDTTSIFVLLDDPRVCEQVITMSKCNLKQKELFLSDLANQFGNALGQHGGLRNANNDLKLSDVGSEVHALSQVLTGALYNILAQMFNKALDPEKESPADTLHHTAKTLRNLYIKALKAGPQKNATYLDVANQMIALSPDYAVKTFIKDEFKSRGVDFKTSYTHTSMEDIEKASFKNCSGSLQSKEFQNLRQQAIDEKKEELQRASQRSYYSPLRWAGY